MRDLLEKNIISFKMEYLAKGVERGSAGLHRAWNSSVNACLGQEGSRFASQVRDIKVPVNSAEQWHRTGIQLEESLKALVFTVLGVSGHFSNNTFSHPYQQFLARPKIPRLTPWFFYQPLSVNIATIIAVITIHVLVCRSNNCRTITGLQFPPLFFFKEQFCDVAFHPSSNACMSNL